MKLQVLLFITLLVFSQATKLRSQNSRKIHQSFLIQENNLGDEHDISAEPNFLHPEDAEKTSIQITDNGEVDINVPQEANEPQQTLTQTQVDSSLESEIKFEGEGSQQTEQDPSQTDFSASAGDLTTATVNIDGESSENESNTIDNEENAGQENPENVEEDTAAPEDQIPDVSAGTEDNSGDATPVEEDDLDIPEPTNPEDFLTELALSNETFEAFYNAYLEILNITLKEMIEAKKAKLSECEAYDSETIEREITKATDYIAWLNDQIQENTDKIDKIYADRCEAHQIFIEYYKNSKLEFRIIAFLREAINGYSLVQIRQVGQILTQYMNPMHLTNKDAVKQMLTQLKQVDEKLSTTGKSLENKEKARTDEQIGSKHVDNTEDFELGNFESSERRSFDSHKQGMLDLLDEFEEVINNEIERRQNLEIELNDSVVDYVTALEKENQQLTVVISEQTEHVDELTAQIAIAAQLQTACDNALQLLDSIIKIQEDLIKNVKENKEELEKFYKAARDVPVKSADSSNSKGGAKKVKSVVPNAEQKEEEKTPKPESGELQI